MAINTRKISSIAAALGDNSSSVVLFLVPDEHALRERGQWAAGIGNASEHFPFHGIHAPTPLAFGATPEDAVTALIQGVAAKVEAEALAVKAQFQAAGARSAAVAAAAAQPDENP